MKQNVSSSDSFGSIDEEVLKELKNVPAVLATQDELDLVEVVKGLRHRLKVQPPTMMHPIRSMLYRVLVLAMYHSLEMSNERLVFHRLSAASLIERLRRCSGKNAKFPKLVEASDIGKAFSHPVP